MGSDGLHTLGMTVPFSLLQRGSGEEKASFNGSHALRAQPCGKARGESCPGPPDPRAPRLWWPAPLLLNHSVVFDSVTRWTVAHQAPLSMGFSRQEHWSGLPSPPPGDLPDPGIEFAVSYVPCIDRRVLYHQQSLGGPGQHCGPPNSSRSLRQTWRKGEQGLELWRTAVMKAGSGAICATPHRTQETEILTGHPPGAHLVKALRQGRAAGPHPDYIPEAVCLLHLGNRKLRIGGQLGPRPFGGAPQGPEQTSGPQIRLVPCSHLPNSEVGVLTFQLEFSGQYYFSW